MITFDTKKTLHWATLVAMVLVVFGGGFFLGQHQLPVKVSQPQDVDFSLFWDAYQKLGEHFIDPSKIDIQKAMYGAIAGMTQSLGDPYTDFFDPAQAKAFQQDLSGSFDGIGVEVGIKKEQLTVVAPLKGTPGERAGLQAGDQIVKINGTPSLDMPIDQAVSLIRGKKGTSVTLTMFRDGWSATKDIVIVRDTIKVVAVEWELKDGNVAYISIHQFDQQLAQDFKQIAHEISTSPAKKIVLDLRNNPGGYLEICQEVAGWFLKPGQIVTIEDFGQGKTKDQYKSEGNGLFSDWPIVVLMNKGSASASEILAGALQDNRNIQLIGEKSFGKGSVQEVVTLNDGKSFLKVTIAKWLTPKGNSISEVGLTPDVKVENSQDAATSKIDAQLDKALEIIKGLQ